MSINKDNRDQEDLLNTLRGLIISLRKNMKDKYKRTTALADLLTDRWEKANFLGFGEGSSVYDDCLVIGDVDVGSNCWIGPYTILDGSGGLMIEDYVTVSSGVHIYTHDNILQTLTSGASNIVHSSVLVKKNVYIGANSIINKGVTIGNYSVIAANSFVNRDIPEYSIYAGTPATKIGDVIVDDKGVTLEYIDR